MCGLFIVVAQAGHANGKLLATPGATPVEGSAGGGIVPWATIAGYGTRDEVGGSAFYSHVDIDDYRMEVYGANFGWRNRLEVSVAQQDFEIKAADIHIRQDIFGIKARLYGDLVYSSWPQISAGVQHKRLRDDLVAASVGAVDDEGTDLYLAASKVWLNGPFNRYLLVNVTARMTKANELGLLGFGGDDNDDYELQLEMSAGTFITENLAIGVEYRQKPNNLGALEEDDWTNVWLALFFNKHFSVTAAWLDLGEIAGAKDQSGGYLSFQAAF